MTDSDSSSSLISDDHELSKHVSWHDYLNVFWNMELDETMDRDAHSLFKEMKVRLIEYSCNILNIVKQWCKEHDRLSVVNNMILPNDNKGTVPMRISDLESELMSKIPHVEALRSIDKVDVDDHIEAREEDSQDFLLDEALGTTDMPEIRHPILINNDVLDEAYDTADTARISKNYNRINDYASSSPFLLNDESDRDTFIDTSDDYTSDDTSIDKSDDTFSIYADNLHESSIESSDQGLSNMDNVATVSANDDSYSEDRETMDLL